MKRLILLLLLASCVHDAPDPTSQFIKTNPLSVQSDGLTVTAFTWNSFGDASYQFDSYFEVSGVAMDSNDPVQGVTVTASSTWGDVTLNPQSMEWMTGPITITCADGWEFYANDIEALRDDLHLEMSPHEIRIWGENDTVHVNIFSIWLHE